MADNVENKISRRLDKPDLMIGVAAGVLLAGGFSTIGTLIVDISSTFKDTRTQNSHEIRGRLMSRDLRTRLGVDTYYATIERNGQREIIVYNPEIVGSKLPSKLYHLFKEGDNLILRVKNTEVSPDEYAGISAQLDK